jgi:hypothetical protein
VDNNFRSLSEIKVINKSNFYYFEGININYWRTSWKCPSVFVQKPKVLFQFLLVFVAKLCVQFNILQVYHILRHIFNVNFYANRSVIR